MIRNVVLHLHGELPMKADIESLPTAADAGLLCTNLRTMEGRKPLSTEFLDSVFLIPYNMIRFLEIPRDVHRPGRPRHATGPSVPLSCRPRPPPRPEGSVIVTPPAAQQPAAAPEPEPEDVALEHLEPDAELLRRIREA